MELKDRQELLADLERYMQTDYSLYLKYENSEASSSNMHFCTEYLDYLISEYRNFHFQYKLATGNYQIKDLDFLIKIETLVAHYSVIEKEPHNALVHAYEKVLETEKNSISYKNALDLLFEKYQDYISSLSFFSNDTYQIIYETAACGSKTLLEEEGYIEKPKTK